ncbi:MAG: carboxymuconolactone decarboxylase family protein [Candidatus Dormiibacterota bacterium]
MSHFYDPHDRRYLRDLSAAAPEVFAAFTAFNDAALHRDDAAIPAKYRELMAVSVALTTQCPFCIEAHTKAAKEAGATPAELAETVGIAMALRAGAAIMHGAEAGKFYAGVDE